MRLGLVIKACFVCFAGLSGEAWAAADPPFLCHGSVTRWNSLNSTLDLSALREFLVRVPDSCADLRREIKAEIHSKARRHAQHSHIDRTGLPTAGTIIRDCEGCPDLVVIPAGQFVMGSSSNDSDHQPDESPQIQVSISSIAVGRYEITFDQWEKCVGEGGCGGYAPDDHGWGRGSRPVIYISWANAHEYTNWLSRKTGHRYRLPSEAEWEFAARAGSVQKYGYGDDPSLLCVYGNVADRDAPWGDRVECSDGYSYTAPVGQFRPNAFGLYDMIGNVSEWVEDCYHKTLQGEDAKGAPFVSSNCSVHVAKGAAWELWDYNKSAATEARLSTRFGSRDDDPIGGDRGDGDGFRVVRELDK